MDKVRPYPLIEGIAGWLCIVALIVLGQVFLP
jgi:hypothetical protein